jgi:hypothetical protein
MEERGMKSIVLATLVTAFAVLGCAQTAHREGARAEKIEFAAAEVVLPMHLLGTAPIVEAMVNGKGPFRFLLDTGAEVTLVTPSLARELGLPSLGETSVGSPGGPPVAAQSIRLERLEIGSAKLHGVPGLSLDLSQVFPNPDSPRGVLSAALFQGLLLTLDYPAGKIVIRPGELPKADGSEVFEYDPADGQIGIPLSIAGIEIKAHVDSGSMGGITLPKGYADQLPLASKPVGVGKARLVGKEITILKARLNGTVRLGRYHFENPDLMFNEAAPVGNIGYEFLRRFSLTLDRKNHRLRLEEGTGAAAGAQPPAQIRPRRYGTRFYDLNDKTLAVAEVDPDSPAEKAGIRAGDQFVQINDTLVEKMSSAERLQILRTSPVRVIIKRGDKTFEVRMSLD